MRYCIFVLIVGVIGLVACSINYDLIPISPVADRPDHPDPVDSLQPTLEWNPYRGPDVTYDVIIYQGVRVKQPYSLGKQLVPGKVIYHRQGIKEPKHTIEEPLKPNTEYCWKIMARTGDKVMSRTATRNFPVFKTPSSK